jgi:TIGR03009 family protein
MMRNIGWPVVVLLLAASCAPVKAANVKLPPPFQATLDEEKNVDCLLAHWEQWNAGVKTFDCRFKRWTYDTVFGRPDQPTRVDFGTIKYAAPDHSLFRVDQTEKNGKYVPVEDVRAEHWVFDGKSIIEYNHVRKQVIVHQVAANFQRSNLVDGPLAFPFPAGLFSNCFFGSPASVIPFSGKSKLLREQCYIREITPPADRHDQIWLDAYPRSSQFGCNFQKLQLIFRASDMSPVAMKIVQSNGKDCTVYQFFDIAVNTPSPPPDGDPFQAVRPVGWQKIIEEPSAAW